MAVPDTRAVVTELDIALRKDLLRYMVSVLGEPCSDGDMPNDRNDELDRIIAAHRIAAEAERAARVERLEMALIAHNCGTPGCLCHDLCRAEDARAALNTKGVAS